MTDDRTLSESDWDVLAAVPFAVFLLVAYADGRLAPAERRASTSSATNRVSGLTW